MKFIEAFNNALFEEKKEETKEKKTEKNKRYVKGLKLFYSVDIKIAEPQQQPAQNIPAPVAPPPATPMPTPVQTAPIGEVPQVPLASTNTENFIEKVNALVEEESINERVEGVLQVSEQEVDNIQTLEDLLDYLSDKKADNGQRIIDDFVIETIYAATGINGTELADILQKEDRMFIDLDYGTTQKDSVGIKILKRSGVSNISIMLKKNGNIIPSKFNLNDFNNQLIVFRNSIFGEKK